MTPVHLLGGKGQVECLVAAVGNASLADDE